jgi:hypothetical protein
MSEADRIVEQLADEVERLITSGDKELPMAVVSATAYLLLMRAARLVLSRHDERKASLQ